MSRQILQDIISDFRAENFTRFFRVKNDKFQHPNQPLHYEDSNFGDGKNLEEITFEDGNMIVCSFRTKQALSERSGKKAQYELGKKILKDTQTDAGIFIFYDQFDNFRFSLIYANYLGRRRDWSTFRRFTYFVSPNLTNKTFLQRIGDGDFSSLAKIKEAFSVEKVTKEFYEDIANWYFWTVENCRFPKDAEAEENGRNVAVIRLITRMIFIWFMRERGLVPKELFEENNIQSVLKDTDSQSSTYYRAILQNLFFATLSTKKEERQFRDEKRFNKGWNKDFGNQYVFRFHNLFVSPEKIKDYFVNIPFLNGGLFECLDDGRNDVYIDGFTERKKGYQPQVPNFLFFSGERKVDLNAYYGTKNKNYKVRGLFNILSSFNFTIDENSPDDADIALDPELLGRVFENLLASFNPETSTTARKATGSYYTPREIVDYMVTESLKEYFKTHLPDIKNIDGKLEILFSTGSDKNPFTSEESKKLVELIESVRIVDPAVGSGAFPMGALNRMVFILNKIDPGNELWKQAQLKAAEAIPDPQVCRNTKKQIEEFFKDKNADYGRKLYLIQKCIYGVDIQQIAVEIAKLRFFISLLVDEKIDETKPNWDIQPLPNLDFKIMRGNSLQSVQTEDLLGSHNKKKLEELKEQLFFEPDHDKKREINREIDRLFNELTDNKRLFDFELYFSEVFNKNGSQNVGFDIVLANPPYIGEKGHKKLFQEVSQYKIDKYQGKQFKYKLGKYYLGKMDYFYFFFHLALDIGKKDAQIAFITTNYYPTAMGARKLRQEFKERGIIRRLVNFNELKIFEAALGQHNMITILQKGQNDNAVAKTAITQRQGVAKHEILRQILNWEDPETSYYKVKQKDLYDGEESYIRLTGNSGVSKNPIQVVLDKIKKQGQLLAAVCNVNQGIVTGANKVTTKHIAKYGIKANVGDGIFVISNREIKDLSLSPSEYKILRPWFKNSDVSRWNTSQSTNEKVIYSNDETIVDIKDFPNLERHLIKFKKIISEYAYRWHDLHRSRQLKIFEEEKIVAPQWSPQNTFGYNEIPWYAASDVYFITEKNKKISLKYVLALLNSRLYYLWLYYRGKRKGELLELIVTPLSEIPIKKISKDEQKPFIDFVDKIIAITKDDDYLQNPAKQAKVHEYEKQIDLMVYELYELTGEEIRIVEEKNEKQN